MLKELEGKKETKNRDCAGGGIKLREKEEGKGREGHREGRGEVMGMGEKSKNSMGGEEPGKKRCYLFTIRMHMYKYIYLYIHSNRECMDAKIIKSHLVSKNENH